jgi:hypothetical protein
MHAPIQEPTQPTSYAFEMSGLVQKLEGRPFFEGPYSRIFNGEYYGMKESEINIVFFCCLANMNL